MPKPLPSKPLPPNPDQPEPDRDIHEELDRREMSLFFAISGVSLSLALAFPVSLLWKVGIGVGTFVVMVPVIVAISPGVVRLMEHLASPGNWRGVPGILRAGWRRRGTERGRLPFLIFIVVMVVANAVVWFLVAPAFSQGDRAAEEALRVVVAAEEVMETDPELGLLLALESLHVAPTIEGRAAILTGLAAFPGLVSGDPTGGRGIGAMATTRDGDTVAIGDDTGTLSLWDPLLRTRIVEIQAHIGSIQALAFSPDGQTLASAGIDGSVRLWNPNSGEPIGHPMQGHAGAVWDLSFREDGLRLVSAGPDDGVIVWDVRLRRMLNRIDTGRSFTVTWSNDGTTVASGSGLQVTLWDAITGERIALLEGHTGTVRTVAFHPNDPRLLASAADDGVVIVWDTETLDQRGSAYATDRGLQTLSFDGNGEHISTGALDGIIRVWKLSGGRFHPDPIAEFDHGHPVQTLTFIGPDLIASGGTGGARVWALTGGQGLAITLAEGVSPVWALDTSPDGHLLASGHADGTVILWDLEDLTLISTERIHTDAVRSLAFHPNGDLLATGDGFGHILLWDVATLQPTGATAVLGGSVRSLAYSPDGGLLAAGDATATISLFKGDSLDLEPDPLNGHDGPVRAVAFGTGRDRLVSGGADGAVLIWDVGERETLEPLLDGHDHRVWAVAFLPSGQVVSTGDDMQVTLWDLETGTHRSETLDNRGWSLAIGPEGHYIAVGDGRTVRLIDTAEMRTVGVRLSAHTDSVRALAFTPNGLVLASAGPDGTILLWDFSTENLVSVACAVANRNLTMAEWNQYRPDETYVRHCVAFPAGTGAPSGAEDAFDPGIGDDDR